MTQRGHGIMFYIAIALMIVLILPALGDIRNWISNRGNITPPTNRIIGIATGETAMYWERWTSEKFQRVKGFGFNTLLVAVWWGQLEYANEAGRYNEARISAMRRQIDLARQADLQIIISCRVFHNPGATFESDPNMGWSLDEPTHRYANYEGRQRYANFVKHLAGKFKDCMICPWHYPYHHTGADSEARQTYYTKTAPLLISSIRSAGNLNRIVINAIHQGESSVGRLYTTEMPNYGLGIIYAVISHGLTNSISSGESQTWTKADSDAIMDRAANLQVKYACEVMSVEYGALAWDGAGLAQYRLDALAYSVSLMNKHNFGYCYWWMSILNRQGDNILSSISDPIQANSQILSILMGT